MTYTQLAAVAVLAVVVLDLVVLRTRVLGRRLFWVSYLIVLGFQLVTNGVLTGLTIVRYDGGAIIGSATPVLLGDGRFVWAPVEDLLFGFALVVSTVSWWVFWGRREARSAGPDGAHPGRPRDGQATPERH